MVTKQCCNVYKMVKNPRSSNAHNYCPYVDVRFHEFYIQISSLKRKEIVIKFHTNLLRDL